MRLALAAAVVASLATSAVAHAADTVVTTVLRPTPIDAYAGRLVWSEWDPAAGTYRLVAHDGVTTRALPVPPSSEPFDADLGPGPGGRGVVVYSRCTRPAPAAFPYDGRRGCDLYRHDLGSEGERRIARASSSADEYAPTVWKNRLAFARVYASRKGRESRRLVHWRRLAGRARTHRLRLGSFARRYGAAAAEPDIRGNRVAVRWDIDFGGELRVSTTGGRTRRLLLIPGSGAATIDYFARGISAVPGFVYWWLRSDRGGEVQRFDLARRKRERATVVVNSYASGFAQDGAVSYYVRPKAELPCSLPACALDPYDIHKVDGLAFEPAPPLQLK